MLQHRDLNVIASSGQQLVPRAFASYFIKAMGTVGDNLLVDALLSSAHDMAEAYLRQALFIQTVEAVYDAIPKEGIFKLPRGPVRSINSITYLWNGVVRTLEDTRYELVPATNEVRLTFNSFWPWHDRTVGTIKISYQTGMAVPVTPADVSPNDLLTAVSHWFVQGDVAHYGVVGGDALQGLVNGRGYAVAALQSPSALGLAYAGSRLNFALPAVNSGGVHYLGAIPAAVPMAICQMVAHWYENREGVVLGTIATQVPLVAQRLLAPYRDGSY